MGHATFFLPFFSSKPLFGPKNGPKIFKKWYLGWFLNILKINIHLDMIFMIFLKSFGWAVTNLFGKNPLCNVAVNRMFSIPNDCSSPTGPKRGAPGAPGNLW